MIWLGIDTANAPLSVAIVKDGVLLAEIVQNVKMTHSIGAMSAIEQLFETVSIKPAQVDAIAVSEGPGSYTGVRIGVTIAKTLAWTLKKPLIGVSSLQVLAANERGFDGLICSLFDARRSHVYSSVYFGEDLSVAMPDRHVSIEQLLDYLRAFDQPILFIGVDVPIYWEQIQQTLGEQAVRANMSNDLPRASALIMLAEQKDLPSVEETHHFVPEYRRIAEAEANWLKEQKQVDQ